MKSKYTTSLFLIVSLVLLSFQFINSHADLSAVSKNNIKTIQQLQSFDTNSIMKKLHNSEPASSENKLTINQLNNIGFEACTGSGLSFICTIQEGDTITLPIECTHPEKEITVRCVADTSPSGSKFNSEIGNPAPATFTWQKAGPAGNYTLAVSAICVSESCPSSPVLLINIIVNSTNTLKNEFIEEALEKICLDPNTDISTLSEDEIRKINTAITGRYAMLYLEDQVAFKWAGMASYASDVVGVGMHTLGRLNPDIFPGFFKSLGDGNIALYKDIAWQHEAFRSGGISVLETIHNQGGLTTEQLNSWRLIDQGKKTNNEQLIWQGNKGLLEYEQKEFLQKVTYDPNRSTWKAITDFPIHKWSPIPHDPITFETYIEHNQPNLKPDIGDSEQRWAWISNNMLPRYQSYETNQHRDHIGQMLWKAIYGSQFCPNVIE